MRAGKNRWRITIQSKSVSLNDVGEETITWVDVGSYWAEKRVLRGREYASEQVETAEEITAFTLRNPTGIDPSMRVTWSTHTYNIRQAVPVGMADKDLELRCTEIL